MDEMWLGQTMQSSPLTLIFLSGRDIVSIQQKTQTLKVHYSCPPSSGEGEQLTNMEQNIHRLHHPRPELICLPWHTQQYQPGITTSLLSESQIPHLFLMKFKEWLVCSASLPICRKQQGDLTFCSSWCFRQSEGSRKWPSWLFLTELGDSCPGCCSPCFQATLTAKPPSPIKQCPSDPGVLVED